MKRTGSASCLLRPKSSLSSNDLQRLARDPPTATVLTVNKLPPYNADRLYIQSELQVHSSLHLLNDIDADSITTSVILYMLWDDHYTPQMFADALSERVRQCLVSCGENVEVEELEEAKASPRLSNYSPRRQLSDPSSDEVEEYFRSPSVSYDENDKCEQSIRIYAVIDKVASPETCESASIGGLSNIPDLSVSSCEDRPPQCQRAINDDKRRKPDGKGQSAKDHLDKMQEGHNADITSARSLARVVASSRFLRHRIDGISIGVTSQSRAAPGLEACMDTVARSCQERRKVSNSTSAQDHLTFYDDNSLKGLRNRSPEKSPVSIVICSHDDLDDASSQHHHHSTQTCQLLQSRITVEWNGKGDYNTFSDRAMNDWRSIWGASKQDRASNAPKRKAPRRSRLKLNDEDDVIDEPISTIMVIVFILWAVWYIWNYYSDYFYSLAYCVSDQQQCVDT